MVCCVKSRRAAFLAGGGGKGMVKIQFNAEKQKAAKTTWRL
jgi:hypothetical protein